MTYLPESVNRFLIHLCFIMIILGIGLSMEWGELLIGAHFSFNIAQFFFIIPSAYFAVNLVSNLIRYPERTLMFEDIQSETVIYSTYLKIPNFISRIIRVAILPIVGIGTIYYYLLPLNPFPYGLTIILSVITIMGSFPAIRETLITRPFRLYLTNSGLYFFLHNYEEILWTDLHSVKRQQQLLLFRIKTGPNLWFDLNSLKESPIFLINSLRNQLDKNNILHNLNDIQNPIRKTT